MLEVWQKLWISCESKWWYCDIARQKEYYFWKQYLKYEVLESVNVIERWHLCMRKWVFTLTGAGNKIYWTTHNLKRVVYVATPPLLLQQGLCVLFVLSPPGVQFSLHGVHVLLYVVHDLTQRQGAAAHRLDGWAEPLHLPRHHAPLLLPRCFRHHVLEVDVVHTMGEVWGIRFFGAFTYKEYEHYIKF